MLNYLESQIDKVVKHIDKLGYHAHKNHPQRSLDGVFISGEPYDYDIFLPNYKACFDAKMCESAKWHLKDKDIKQANILKKCKKAGMDAFFLVYFVKDKKLLKFDVDIIIEQLQTSKSISQDLGIKWEIERVLKNV